MPELWSQERQPLLRNGSANTPIARQWLDKRHVTSATLAYATIEEMLEAVFSIRSAASDTSHCGKATARRYFLCGPPRGYLYLENRSQRRQPARTLCRNRGTRKPGIYDVGSRYQATNGEDRLRRLSACCSELQSA
jgi:hypothetical protein